MPKEYDSFVDDPTTIPDKGEMNLAIREHTPDDWRKKYKTRYVRAYITKSPEVGQDDILWLRYQRGALHPTPFGIKIVKELGDFEPRAIIGVRGG